MPYWRNDEVWHMRTVFTTVGIATKTSEAPLWMEPRRSCCRLLDGIKNFLHRVESSWWNNHGSITHQGVVLLQGGASSVLPGQRWGQGGCLVFVGNPQPSGPRTQSAFPVLFCFLKTPNKTTTMKRIYKQNPQSVWQRVALIRWGIKPMYV